MKQPCTESPGSIDLTRAERRVLAVFRQFLMTPGQMLCFCGYELEACDETLRAMSQKGLVMPERVHGAYSLTKLGFRRMRQAYLLRQNARR